jgi:LysM repeat protein
MSIDATPDLVWNFWVNSRSHYNNLTNWNFKDVGIGMATDGYRISYVMVFATPFDPVQLVDASPGPAAEAAPSAEVTTVGAGEHLVQAGENLYRIALRYGVSVDALAGTNGISDPRLLSVGQVLVIPGGGLQVTEASVPAEVPQAESVVAADGTHVVQSGENLFRLAMQYGVSVDALAAANNISDPRRLSVGQVLVVAMNENE